MTAFGKLEDELCAPSPTHLQNPVRLNFLADWWDIVDVKITTDENIKKIWFIPWSSTCASTILAYHFVQFTIFSPKKLNMVRRKVSSTNANWLSEEKPTTHFWGILKMDRWDNEHFLRGLLLWMNCKSTITTLELKFKVKSVVSSTILKVVPSAGNVTLLVLLGYWKVMLVDSLQKEVIIRDRVIFETHDALKGNFRRKLRKGMLFHYDNVPSHTSGVAMVDIKLISICGTSKQLQIITVTEWT